MVGVSGNPILCRITCSGTLITFSTLFQLPVFPHTWAAQQSPVTCITSTCSITQRSPQAPPRSCSSRSHSHKPGSPKPASSQLTCQKEGCTSKKLAVSSCYWLLQTLKRNMFLFLLLRPQNWVLLEVPCSCIRNQAEPSHLITLMNGPPPAFIPVSGWLTAFQSTPSCRRVVFKWS